MNTTNTTPRSNLMDELRHHAAPLELLRNTYTPRFERNRPRAPDSQFEFLPRRPLAR